MAALSSSREREGEVCLKVRVSWSMIRAYMAGVVTWIGGDSATIASGMPLLQLELGGMS